MLIFSLLHCVQDFRPPIHASKSDFDSITKVIPSPHYRCLVLYFFWFSFAFTQSLSKSCCLCFEQIYLTKISLIRSKLTSETMLRMEPFAMKMGTCAWRNLRQ